MIREAISRIIGGQHMTIEEAALVMTEIMEGEATHAQIASLLTGMRMKGETSEEVEGFVRTMRQKSIRVEVAAGIEVVDTCGTGGDKLNTFNISTAAAFVAAGAGVPIAKHGNRAASSKCGSADVLEEIGINISLDADLVSECIAKVGIGFMFAPALHPAMKHAVAPRKEMGIRTVFNLLGPMTNPAGASRQVIGVFSPEYTEVVAHVLMRLGSSHAMVFHGTDGLDEISTVGPTILTELKAGRVSTSTIDAVDFGLKRATPEDLIEGTGTIQDSAKALLEVLQGRPGPKRDIVLLNAAAALVVNENASGLEEGMRIAALSIDSGRAMQKLEMLRSFSAKVAA